MERADEMKGQMDEAAKARRHTRREPATTPSERLKKVIGAARSEGRAALLALRSYGSVRRTST